MNGNPGNCWLYPAPVSEMFLQASAILANEKTPKGLSEQKYGRVCKLTWRLSFVLGGPGRNIHTMGVEVGTREMQRARREMISKNLYAHNTEQSFWKS